MVVSMGTHVSGVCSKVMTLTGKSQHATQCPPPPPPLLLLLLLSTTPYSRQRRPCPVAAGAVLLRGALGAARALAQRRPSHAAVLSAQQQGRAWLSAWAFARAFVVDPLSCGGALHPDARSLLAVGGAARPGRA